tara:strand:- start:27376 stop:28122 length:747 start_codon:yes stop_codon:yes gene_type:complete
MNHEIIYNIAHDDNNLKLGRWLQPAMKMLPQWYRDLKIEGDKGEMDGHVNVKTCVSFLYLWQNSYLLLCPCDIEIDLGPDGYEVHVEDDQAVRFNSHTYEEDQPRNQMGSGFNPDWMNLKFETPISIMSTEHRLDLIWQQPFYWDQQQEIVTAPGVLPVLPNRSTGLNINTFINKSRRRTIKVPKGFPIASIYSASGKIEWIQEPDRNYFLATANTRDQRFEAKVYYKATKTCPYHEPNTNDIKEHKS